ADRAAERWSSAWSCAAGERIWGNDRGADGDGGELGLVHHRGIGAQRERVGDVQRWDDQDQGGGELEWDRERSVHQLRDDAYGECDNSANGADEDHWCRQRWDRDK